MPKAFNEVVSVDSIIVTQAYREFKNLDDNDYNIDEQLLDEFAQRNWEVLVEMAQLADKMMQDYNNSEQYNKFDPEPVEVFLLSAPQHLKHKLT